MPKTSFLKFPEVVHKLTPHKHNVIPFDPISDRNGVDAVVHTHIQTTIEELRKKKINKFSFSARDTIRINELNTVVVEKVNEGLKTKFMKTELLDSNSYGDILLTAKYDDEHGNEARAYYYIEVIVSSSEAIERLDLRYMYLSNRLKNITKPNASHLLLFIRFKRLANLLGETTYKYVSYSLSDLFDLKLKKKVEYNASILDILGLKKF